MPSRRHDVRLSLPKTTDKDIIRFNLMLSSLYLLAYEVLFGSIVDGTFGFFDVERQPATEEGEEFDRLRATLEGIHPSLADDLGQGPVKAWLAKADRFQSEVGVSPLERSTSRLLRSCARWLNASGVFDDQDLATIERILAHRHRIAHELPSLIIGEGFDVDLGLFPAVLALIRKADLFWFRNDIFDTTGISDDQVRSPSLIILNHIVAAVSEYTPNPPIPRDASIH